MRGKYNYQEFLENTRILFVTNDLNITQAIDSYLINKGCTVKIVAQTNKATHLCEQWEPHLILFDMMLSDDSFVKACIQLRDKSYESCGSVIFIAPKDKPSVVKLLESFNGGDCVYKPVDVEELKSRIDASLHRTFDNQLIQISSSEAMDILQGYGLDEFLLNEDEPTFWAAVLAWYWGTAISSSWYEKNSLPICLGFAVNTKQGDTILKQWLLDKTESNQLRVNECQCIEETNNWMIMSVDRPSKNMNEVIAHFTISPYYGNSWGDSWIRRGYKTWQKRRTYMAM